MRWNPINGIYLLTGSRDNKIKMYDIRNMKNEVKDFDGHTETIQIIQWHPFKETIFASACHNGSIIYWKSTFGKLHDIKQAHQR